MRNILILALLSSPSLWAADATLGQQLWQSSDYKQRSCVDCHGTDLSQPGKHLRTGKTIAPMSPAVNPKRLSKPKKTEKWFKRNCKWTLGRLCTPEEKANILAFLKTQ